MSSRLKSKGNSVEVAEYIGQILNSTSNSYSSSSNKEHIIELITFLYENNQKQIADDFCNKVTKLEDKFLVEIYNKYK